MKLLSLELIVGVTSVSEYLHLIRIITQALYVLWPVHDYRGKLLH